MSTYVQEDIHIEEKDIPRQQPYPKRLKESLRLFGVNPKDPVRTYVASAQLMNEYVPQTNKLGVQLYYGRSELGKRMRKTHSSTNDDMMYHGMDEYLSAIPVNVIDGEREFDKLQEYPNIVAMDDLTNRPDEKSSEVELNKFKTAGDLMAAGDKNFLKKTHAFADNQTS